MHLLLPPSTVTGFPKGVQNIGELRLTPSGSGGGSSKFDGGLSQYMGGAWGLVVGGGGGA